MTKHPEQIPKINLNQSGFTKCETTFFLPTTVKHSKNMPNHDVHAKQNFLMRNHFKKG